MSLTDDNADSSSTESSDSFYEKTCLRMLKISCKPIYGKVKIELCRNFMENHYCIYGNRCNFAHGY